MGQRSQLSEGSPDLAAVAARLGRLLHAAGVPVSPDRSGRMAAAMGLAFPVTTAQIYWVARVTLLSGHDHIEIFDRVFAQVFGGVVDPAEWRGDRPDPPPPAHPEDLRPDRQEARRDHPSPQPAPQTPAPGEEGGDNDGPLNDAVLAALSAEERLTAKDFGTLSAEELLALRSLTGRMAFVTPPRRSRRHVRSHRGATLDVRATLRRARRTGGQPLVAVRRHRRTRSRRLVLVCDISGSMEPYARAYVQLLMSGVGGARAEAFVFATRLTRLTRALRTASPDLALERAGRAAPDWSGGTRIGEAIKAFNDDHGRRGAARGAVVVILSDGWDRGDPALLGREMERLRRLAYRVIWVNPRKANPAYQPLTAGMSAALPHLDKFVSGHSLRAFDEVLAAIREPGR